MSLAIPIYCLAIVTGLVAGLIITETGEIDILQSPSTDQRTTTEMQEILKGKIIYVKVNEELFEILGDTLKNIGKDNPIKIGDIVAMDEYRVRLSSEDEIAKIPEEKIISRTIDKNKGLEGIVVIRYQ